MAIREVDGRQVPAAGTWVIDPTHTTIEFVARHLMVSKIRGGFKEFGGSMEIGEDPASSSVSVEVTMASVSTGTEDRDNHLKSSDFFDTENHPTMTFRSTAVAPSGDGWTVTGDLTINATTQPVSLDTEFLGVVTDPYGNAKAAFSSKTTIDREDFGLTWNVPLETGGFLVSKRIDIEIEAQAVLQG